MSATSPERIHQVRETLRIQSIRIDVEGAMDRARRELETFDALLAERARDAEVVEKAVACKAWIDEVKAYNETVGSKYELNPPWEALYEAVERRERG